MPTDRVNSKSRFAREESVLMEKAFVRKSYPSAKLYLGSNFTLRVSGSSQISFVSVFTGIKKQEG